MLQGQVIGDMREQGADNAAMRGEALKTPGTAAPAPAPSSQRAPSSCVPRMPIRMKLATLAISVPEKNTCASGGA